MSSPQGPVVIAESGSMKINDASTGNAPASPISYTASGVRLTKVTVRCSLYGIYDTVSKSLSVTVSIGTTQIASYSTTFEADTSQPPYNLDFEVVGYALNVPAGSQSITISTSAPTGGTIVIQSVEIGEQA